MVKFELNDDNLLRLNGALVAGHSVWSAVDPSSYHDVYYGANAPRSDVKDRWYAIGLAGITAANVAVAESNGIGARDAKKNLLIANGAIWGAAALHHGYNISAGNQKKDALMIGNVVAMAGLSALNIWKGAGGKDKKAKATVK